VGAVNAAKLPSRTTVALGIAAVLALLLPVVVHSAFAVDI